ncbi:DUF732 domain-containing protein [Mycobacterium sp. SMC-11]|uniref:DUF732 domain-containing protein n=1 Tax=Mycobacterium sp. SMC-11 TaxID=3385969 RepID=UPI00390C845A
MARLAMIVGAALFSALALAGPAQADDRSYLDYLHSHPYEPANWAYTVPDTQLELGHRACGWLRAGQETPESAMAAFDGNSGYGIVPAAQHELCPETLSAAPPKYPAASPEDDQRYLGYLHSQPYEPANYAYTVPDIQVKMGHRACGWLRAGLETPESAMAAFDGRAGYGIVPAAQQELCPDTLGPAQ